MQVTRRKFIFDKTYFIKIKLYLCIVKQSNIKEMENNEIKAVTVYQVIVYFEGVFSSHGFYEDMREAEQKRDSVATDMWNADAEGEVFIEEIKH